MRYFLLFLLLPAMIMGFSSTVRASQIITTNIAQMTDGASDIIRAQCKEVAADFKGATIKGAKTIGGKEPRAILVRTTRLLVTDVIKGNRFKVGDEAVITTNAGFVGAGGRIFKASIQPVVICGDGNDLMSGASKAMTKNMSGQDRIVFVRPQKSSLGIDSTSGMQQGVFNVENGQVKNVFMKFDLFKGMKIKKPGVAKAMKAGGVDLAAPPSSMSYDAFTKMIKGLEAAKKE